MAEQVVTPTTSAEPQRHKVAIFVVRPRPYPLLPPYPSGARRAKARAWSHHQAHTSDKALCAMSRMLTHEQSIAAPTIACIPQLPGPT